jgi:aerobic-type carbon monoxide dehydrogenase small subunit (CoxS/CutS family)
MILVTKELLDSNPEPTDAEIRQALDGNLCRCTGYVKQVEAVKNAAKKMSQKAKR